MKEKLIIGILIIVGLSVVGAVGYGLWMVQRNLHYKFGYESLVQETVCETVRPEYLIEGKCE